MKLIDLYEKSASYKLGSIPVIKLDGTDHPRAAKTTNWGEGAQSWLREHPADSNSVIKYTNIGMPFENDPFVQFMNMCMYHQDNPFFPKIKSVKIYEHDIEDRKTRKRTAGGTMVTVMEKLEEIAYTSKGFEKILASCEPNMAYFQKHFSNDIDAEPGRAEEPVIRPNSSVIKASVTMEHMINWLFWNGGWNDLFNSGEVIHAFNSREFLDAVRLLAPLIRIFNSDLHYENLMLRGDQMVIQDPMYHGKMNKDVKDIPAGHR